MKIIIVRHADPDYSIDSLTKKGWREAKYLTQTLTKMGIDDFYVSPLGRAKDTASFTLKELGKTATEYEWLREFAPRIVRPDCPEKGKTSIAWDWIPEIWTKNPEMFDKDNWLKNEIYQDTDVEKEYNWVITEFDKVLERYGYVREGNAYKVVEESHKAICFVCHFGLECVLLSHLLNISPVVLWHGFCAPPSSVTTLYTEERRKGVAYFRMQSFGDTKHLYMNDEEIAFAARFCECFSDDTRHD